MGTPLPPFLLASGTPASGDQANAVVSGTITAIGPTLGFPQNGQFNVSMWSAVTTTLTLPAGSVSGNLASATGVAVGDTVQSTLIPAGATVSVLVSTSVTLAGLTTTQIAAIAGGADAAAKFIGNGSEATGIVILEKTFDGGTTWVPAATDKLGTAATYQFGTGKLTYPVSVTFSEPEKGVSYRLNCTALSAGNISYRISATGAAALTFVPPN